MTARTLQERVDAIFNEPISNGNYTPMWSYVQVSSAIRELRQKVLAMPYFDGVNTRSDYVNREQVLALIGEQK